MYQIMSTNWMQPLLIVAGVVLQVVAIAAMIRSKLEHRMLPTDLAAESEDQDEDAETPGETSSPKSTEPTRWRPSSPAQQSGQMSTGRMAKTSKVSFKQSFKFSR